MAGIDQKTLWDFARIVLKGAGVRQSQPVQAKFLRTDPDGTQWVQLAGSTEETPVNGKTLASAKAGDTVELEISDGVLSLDGNASEPSVGMRSAKKVANEAAEGARRMAADAGRAAELSKQIADAAQQVANAVNQHFFTDTSGIHVTAATQDDWNSNHTGANVLINALGQLFRDGLTNLLAILTTGVAIYDGNGNDAENVLASFTGNGASIGYETDAHVSIGSDGVTIYDGDGNSSSIAVVTFTGEVDSAGRRRSYIDTGDPTDGSSAAEVIGTVEDTDYGSYVLRKREVELFAYAPSGTDSGSVSAWAQTSTDGTFDESGVALYGKWLNLNHESTYISVPMEQAGAMLSVDSATLTRGSGASSWSDGTVRRSGKVVTVTINGAKLASALASSGTSGSITTIPTGYRPSNLQRGTACLSTTGNYANVWFVVSTTGGVAIANRSSLQIPTTAEINMQITYIID